MAIIKIRDKDGNIIPVPALQGPPYELTEEDKTEITNRVINGMHGATHYCHNIRIWYRHSSQPLNKAGSNGNYVATFTIINEDPTPYAFNHYYHVFEAKNMPSDIAWQLLRLYQAMQFSTARTDIKKRPCAGASKNVIASSDGKSYSLKLGINSSIATHYTLSDSVYKRQISLYNTYDGSNMEESVITFDCGVATFNSNDQEISIWKSEQELVDNEFTAVDSEGIAYSPYFSNQLITCEDNVEEINLVLT